MSGIRNHPVLLSLSRPRLVIGYRTVRGVPWPDLLLRYPRPFPEGAREWWRMLGSPSAHWWVSVGRYNRDPSLGWLSLNASARVQEVPRPEPIFAATIRCPVQVSTRFESVLLQRDRLHLALQDPSWRYRLEVGFRRNFARCAGDEPSSVPWMGGATTGIASAPMFWDPQDKPGIIVPP